MPQWVGQFSDGLEVEGFRIEGFSALPRATSSPCTTWASSCTLVMGLGTTGTFCSLSVELPARPPTPSRFPSSTP